jgi:predicted dehydrogenase
MAELRRVGIVGTGLIGHKRAEALRGLGLLVGAYDTDSDRKNSFARAFGVQPAPSLLELIEAVGEGGLILVCTPNAALAPSAKSAVLGGCDALVEKPCAVSHQEAIELAALAKNHGRRIYAGYNHRFHPGITALFSTVTSGRFGDVLSVRGRYGHGGRPGYEKEWRFSPDMSGGGQLMDQGTHLIDLVTLIAGKVDVSYASIPTLYWEALVEDNAFIAGKSQRGAHVWIHASWTEWKNLFSLEVFCRTAKLEVTGLGGSYGPETFTIHEMPGGLGVPLSTSIQYPPGDSSWRLELERVFDTADADVMPAATIEDGVGVLEVVKEVYSRDYQ